MIYANDIHIIISIDPPDKWYFERDRWLTYEYVELERLKPQESFPSSYLDSNTSKWYKSELRSLKHFPKISLANSYAELNQPIRAYSCKMSLLESELSSAFEILC